MFVVLCIFCYEETCSFLAHYTKDVPISSIPFCLPVFARHMQGVPTALLQKILPHLRDIDKKSLDLNSKKKKKEPDTRPPRQRSQLCLQGAVWVLHADPWMSGHLQKGPFLVLTGHVKWRQTKTAVENSLNQKVA